VIFFLYEVKKAFGALQKEINFSGSESKNVMQTKRKEAKS
jgi:hypothetical protein